VGVTRVPDSVLGEASASTLVRGKDRIDALRTVAGEELPVEDRVSRLLPVLFVAYSRPSPVDGRVAHDEVFSARFRRVTLRE
jgi:hypothetical protein